MKYDIAKNDEGPLRRTVKSESAQGKKKQGDEDEASKMYKDRPFDERLTNLETHLAVRYGGFSYFFLPSYLFKSTKFMPVPSPPQTIAARLKFLEDHIIQLEKEYPPWAALHFNQPNRGVRCVLLQPSLYQLKPPPSGPHRLAPRLLLSPPI